MLVTFHFIYTEHNCYIIRIMTNIGIRGSNKQLLVMTACDKARIITLILMGLHATEQQGPYTVFQKLQATLHVLCLSLTYPDLQGFSTCRWFRKRVLFCFVSFSFLWWLQKKKKSLPFKRAKAKQLNHRKLLFVCVIIEAHLI